MSDQRRRLALKLSGMDDLPDYGLGPMTPDTIAGRTTGSQGEWRSGPGPVDPTLQAILNYGPLPAQIATDVAMQPVRGGEAIADAIQDPTIGKVTNAGFQGALSFMRPLMALKLLGAGYGAAGASDLFGAGIGEAEASPEEVARLDKEIAALQKQFETASKRAQSASGASRREAAGKELDALGRRLDELGKQRGALVKLDADQKAASEASQRAEYDRRVATAEAARAKALSRDDRFSDSALKDVYESTGGPVPLAAAAAGGAGVLRRMGKGIMKEKIAGSALAGDVAEGTAAAFTVNNAPIAYDAIMAPIVNPEYEAAMAMANELPDGHPRKAEFQETAKRMKEQGLDRNPVREEAWEDFTDPYGMTKRLGMSVLEGFGAPLGRMVPDAIAATGRNALRVPGDIAQAGGEVWGRASAGYHRGMRESELQRAMAERARRRADIEATRPLPPPQQGTTQIPDGSAGANTPSGQGGGQQSQLPPVEQSPQLPIPDDPVRPPRPIGDDPPRPPKAPPLKPGEQKSIHRALAEGKPVPNADDPRVKRYVAKLNAISRDTGTSVSQLYNAIATGAKRTPYAAPLAIPFLYDEDE